MSIQLIINSLVYTVYSIDQARLSCSLRLSLRRQGTTTTKKKKRQPPPGSAEGQELKRTLDYFFFFFLFARSLARPNR